MSFTFLHPPPQNLIKKEAAFLQPLPLLVERMRIELTTS